MLWGTGTLRGRVIHLSLVEETKVGVRTARQLEFAPWWVSPQPSWRLGPVAGIHPAWPGPTVPLLVRAPWVWIPLCLVWVLARPGCGPQPIDHDFRTTRPTLQGPHWRRGQLSHSHFIRTVICQLWGGLCVWRRGIHCCIFLLFCIFLIINK